MSTCDTVIVIHAIFALFLIGAIVWCITRPEPRDEYLLADFLYIERRKRVADRRAKRRSPESNGRRITDK